MAHLDAWPPKNIQPQVSLRVKRFRSTRRRPGQGSTTPTYPTPRTRCPTSRAPMTAMGGIPGWCRASASSTTGPMCPGSEPLAEDLTIAGDVVAHLCLHHRYRCRLGGEAYRCLSDSVTDRIGDGWVLLWNADIMRGRYWKNFSTPAPIRRTPSRHSTSTCTSSFTVPEASPPMVQSEHLVPALRPQPADICRQHSGPANRLQGAQHRIWHTPRYPSHLSQCFLGQPSVS